VLRAFREYRRKMPKAKSTGSKALRFFFVLGATQQQRQNQQQTASCATNALSLTHTNT